MLHEGSHSSLCASFEFIKDLDLYKEEKPYRLTTFNLEMGFDVENTNIETEWVTDVKVHDVRNHNAELSLGEDGFKYFIHETLLGTRFEDDKFDEDTEAMTIFVKNELQAEKAIRTDFRIREPSAVKNERRNRATETRATPTGAATLVHTDHTLNEGLRFVKAQLNPVEREKYLSGEYYYRIINLWKPLIDVIEDNPLGLLDPRSVKPCDILEADNITNKWEGEIFLIKHNSEQRWWYLSKQKRNELWLFVAFDSRMEKQLTCKPSVAPETS